MSALPHAGTSNLLLELGAIILGLALLARAARTFGISPIPFYLLAGLAFGEGGVFPLPTTKEFVGVAGEIGAVLLLLMLGLEYSSAEFVSSLRRAAPAGVVDLVLNFSPGFAAGLLLGWSPLASAYLGGVTLVTSSGVMSKVLTDLGRTLNPETALLLSIAVIEDLVMAVYLPVVSGLSGNRGTASAIVSIGVALAATVVVLFVAVRHGTTLSRIAFSPSSEVLLLTVLGVTLVVAGAAERMQMSAAVGAFLVGMAISGPAAERAASLLSPLRNLFAAVFFLLFGLELDPAAIPPVLGIATALAVVTAGTKFLTGWWAAGREGIDVAGRLRTGTTLIARGEFSIVIAGLAVLGNVEPRIGPMAATYVMILAVAGPILAKYAARWVRAPGDETAGRVRSP